MSKIDQKEYLKKYLSGDKRKKKKKEIKENKFRVKIIDDDIDVIKHHEEDDDLILTGEDAPQIVGVIDDRPPELRTIEDFRGSEKWKPLSNATKELNDKNNTKTDSRIETKKFNAQSKEDERNNYKSYSKTSEHYKGKNGTSTFEDDFSPQRKRRVESNDDFSPQRKRRIGSNDDFSPPRKRDAAKRQQNKTDKSNKSRRRSRSSSDFSPSRNSGAKVDSSDYSPPRRKIEKYRESDYSPPRRKDKKTYTKSVDQSPPRKTGRRANDLSPIKQKQIPPNEIAHKMEQTLEGKKAGLQDASALKKETEHFRKKENDMFKRMSSDISGKNCEIGVRNIRRKTDAEIQREQEKEYEKTKREKEKQEAYSRWGIGLKQIEDYQNKIANELHEKNKPLARYSNDADLDEMLKKQEREGDPMLEYIREKNKEAKKNNKTPVIPIYKGSFPENRFNIRPGYRWDGVDRSNGYEKKWFDVQNQKKAIQEEAYKYSVEDM